MDKTKLGASLVIISALGFGTSAIFAKLAYSQGVNLNSMLALRFTIACLIIWAIIILFKQPFKASPTQLKQMAILSLLGFGGGSTFFFLSLKLLPASLASMLLYTYPVLVAVADQIIYRYRITRIKVAALLLSTTGLLLILGATVKGVNLPGVLYGFGAAISYSAYLVYGNRVVRKNPPILTTVYMLTFAAAGFTISALATGTLSFDFQPSGWWSIAGLAVFSTALAILALIAGLKWIDASHAAIISSFEPVFTVAAASLIFSEIIRPLQLTGAILILAAILLLQLKSVKDTDKRALG